MDLPERVDGVCYVKDYTDNPNVRRRSLSLFYHQVKRVYCFSDIHMPKWETLLSRNFI